MAQDIARLMLGPPSPYKWSLTLGVYAEKRQETPEETDARIRRLMEDLKSLEVRGGQLTQDQDDLADDIAHEIMAVVVRRCKGEGMMALSAAARLAAEIISGPSADIFGAHCGEELLAKLVSGHVVVKMAEKHLHQQEDAAHARQESPF